VNGLDLLDLIIVGIIALGGWNGYRTGLFRQVTRLFGAVIAYFLSLWLKPFVAPVVASFLSGHTVKAKPPGVIGLFLGDLSGAIAFGLVFVVSFVLIRYALVLIDALFQLPVLSLVNRLAGLVVGLVLATLFVYVGSLVLSYVNNDRVQTELADSAIVQWMHAQQWPHKLP
jgi:uncharacterized membrane protein required for colicin V production